MSNHAVGTHRLTTERKQSDQSLWNKRTEQNFEALPGQVTRAASKQTYYIIRFLVDRDLVADAYRAYAYFRWLDDCLDCRVSDPCERIAFVECQKALVESCYQGERPHIVSDEEQLLVELIRRDREQNSGVQSYIRNLMDVMAFDAERRGRLISQAELTAYSRHLSTAVTEALHYFIGHNQPTPHGEARYLAANGAHVTHMLRDTYEDVEAGYFNIPREFMEDHGLDPCNVGSDLYGIWVKSRVQLARAYFKAGKEYLAQIKNLRCRIAGYTYISRFERVLDTIENDGYRLRADYSECKSLKATLGLGWSVLAGSLN